MGNRSRFTAVGATSVALGLELIRRARRRARLERATRAIAQELAPDALARARAETQPLPVEDDAHAPGHAHLRAPRWAVREATTAPGPSRLFRRHRHGRLRHQGFP